MTGRAPSTSFSRGAPRNPFRLHHQLGRCKCLPVDRRKKGSKHALRVDRHGVPLAIRTAGANASDHMQIIPIVLDFPHIGGKPGRPKELPDAVYTDRGFDSDATRWILAWLGVEPHIARRKAEPGSGLGSF
jgi:hypothetical protein